MTSNVARTIDTFNKDTQIRDGKIEEPEKKTHAEVMTMGL